MTAIRHQSDSATAARFRAKQKHAEPVPQKAVYRLHNIAVIRADRNRREALWGPGYQQGVEI